MADSSARASEGDPLAEAVPHSPTSPGPAPDPASLSTAVVIASAGRPGLLAEVIRDLQRQTRPDFTLVVSVPDQASLPPLPLPAGTRLAVGTRGAAAQRNAGLDLVPEATHVFVFDDDSVVREDYIEHALDFFEAHPEVVGLTGHPLLDGATGAEIGRDEAVQALRQSLEAPIGGTWTRSRELYGCNFVFRPPAAPGERFDGRLPLYSWLEDHDLARRLMRHGALAKVQDCVVVHRGVKSGGRVAHARLGYSQVMNPAYLHHVGSFPLWLALHETIPRVGKNAVRAIRGGESTWRRERLRGNFLALRDVARRRFTPERILDMPAA
jgi:hypothetical protein